MPEKVAISLSSEERKHFLSTDVSFLAFLIFKINVIELSLLESL